MRHRRTHTSPQRSPEDDDASMPLGAILAAMGAAQVDAEAIAAARLTGRAQVAGVRAILALRKLALAAAKAAIPYRHARKRAANDDLDPNSHDAWVLAMEEEERSAAERAPPSARADERLAVALAAGAAPSASPAESAAAGAPQAPPAPPMGRRALPILSPPRPHTHPATRPPPGRPSAVR